MARNEGFDEDPLSCGGTYSHLMDSDMGESFLYSPSTFHSVKPPTMLCFGNVNSSKEEKGFIEKGKVTQKSGITGTAGSDSSSNSSSNNSSSSNSFTISKQTGQIEEPIKTEQEIRNGLGSEPNLAPLPAPGTISGSRRTSKKAKKENPNSSRPVKAKKEKLGERITALQQLVSPFGKTDTASVLHEAMGYIRFLHDQVQVLSSPYLQKLPSSANFPEEGGRIRRGEMEDEAGRLSDLRSRGLCLVPVEYTLHVANCNGADLWSPAAAMGSHSSASCSKN